MAPCAYPPTQLQRLRPTRHRPPCARTASACLPSGKVVSPAVQACRRRSEGSADRQRPRPRSLRGEVHECRLGEQGPSVPPLVATSIPRGAVHCILLHSIGSCAPCGGLRIEIASLSEQDLCLGHNTQGALPEPSPVRVVSPRSRSGFGVGWLQLMAMRMASTGACQTLGSKKRAPDVRGARPGPGQGYAQGAQPHHAC